MIPRKVSQMVRKVWWYCGIEGKGHYHLHESTALNCINARKSQKKLKDLTDRNVAIIDRWLIVRNYRIVAEEFDLSADRIRTILMEYCRAILKTKNPLTPKRHSASSTPRTRVVLTPERIKSIKATDIYKKGLKRGYFY